MQGCITRLKSMAHFRVVAIQTKTQLQHIIADYDRFKLREARGNNLNVRDGLVEQAGRILHIVAKYPELLTTWQVLLIFILFYFCTGVKL